MRRRVWTVLGSGLLVAALSSGAQAQISARLFDRLDLTDAQRAQLTEMQSRHQEAAQAARAEMIKARAELEALMVVSDRDITAIERAMKKVSDLGVADRVRALKNHEEMLAVLTVEQRATLDTLGRRAGAVGAMNGAGWNRPGLQGGRTQAGRGRALRALRFPGRAGLVRAGRAIPPRAGFGPGAGRMGPMAGFGRGAGGMAPGDTPMPMRMRMHRVNPDTPPPPPAT